MGGASRAHATALPLQVKHLLFLHLDLACAADSAGCQGCILPQRCQHVPRLGSFEYYSLDTSVQVLRAQADAKAIGAAAELATGPLSASKFGSQPQALRSQADANAIDAAAELATGPLAAPRPQHWPPPLDNAAVIEFVTLNLSPAGAFIVWYC